MTTYSPEERAWQLIVAAVLDDDPRDDSTGADPLDDELLAGMDDRALETLCAAAGMAAALLRALAEARGTTAEELVKQFGAGLSEEF